MRVSGLVLMGLTTSVVACAVAARGRDADVRSPLGAMLSSGARTGAPVALRFDPNARVIRSTASGLPPASYLPSQAARGQQIYEGSCGTCHQPEQFVGQAFVESWGDRRVYDLYALVRGTMPLDNPGGLKDGDYLDVIAYLLQANRHKATGIDSLRADTLELRSTRIAVGAP